MNIIDDCPAGWRHVGPGWIKGCVVRHHRLLQLGIVIDAPSRGSGPFPNDDCVSVVFAINNIPSLRVVRIADIQLA